MDMRELIKAYSLCILNVAPDISNTEMIHILTDMCFDLMRHVATLEEKIKVLEADGENTEIKEGLKCQTQRS